MTLTVNTLALDTTQSDTSGNSLFKITNLHRYTKLNDNQPTYTNDSTGKQDVKDLIFSSPSMTRTFTEFGVEEDLGSDHSIITATFSQKGINNTLQKKTVKLYHKADWTHINNTITNKMSNISLNHKATTKDIDNYITQLTTTINNTINDNVKTKTINNKQPGLPKHIREMIKEKKYLRKKWQQTGNLYYKTQYNTLNKDIKTIIKQTNQDKWGKNVMT